MSKQKKESFFWTSYSDLMTSLFFVMLVLFVLVIVLLHNKMVEIEKEKQATEQQLNKIQEIEESVKNIDTSYFKYDTDFKRHTLKNITVSFRIKSSNINDIPKEQRDRLLKAGHSIRSFVNEAVKKNPEVKYLLIVEGQASKDTYQHNFELSYERALALVNFWRNNGLNFNSNNCEIIISGSGTESLFRVENDESANQRFVIHIIPKTGVIEKK
jgi:outer membrane protein OmpA-like peptidoglycan-associated protein